MTPAPDSLVTIPFGYLRKTRRRNVHVGILIGFNFGMVAMEILHLVVLP